eukprot:jgi/Bigna1/89339/estExt_fgenesh1_pg.C_470096
MFVTSYWFCGVRRSKSSVAVVKTSAFVVKISLRQRKEDSRRGESCGLRAVSRGEMERPRKLRRLGSTVMFLDEAATIRQMGFDDEVKIIGALREASGKVHRAVEILTRTPTGAEGGDEKGLDPNGFEGDEHLEDDEEAKEKGKHSKPHVNGKKEKKGKDARKEEKLGKVISDTTSGKPLKGMMFCVSGEMSVVRKHFHSELLEAGGSISKTVTRRVTHLITTESEVANPTRKLLAAAKNNCFVVSEVYTCIPFFLQDFVRECIRLDRHIDEEEFIIYRKGGKSAENVEFLESSKKGGKAAKRITDESWAVVATTKLMLAEKWRERISPTGYWISEKLDGVRAFWSGKAFYSRRGNQFPAPDWFKAKMPQNVELDGELWCGRRMFRRSLAIVRNAGSDKLWQYVTYQVFDLPCAYSCFWRGRGGLFVEKPKVGLCPRTLRCAATKVKNFQDEEAKVMRYQDGKGKHVGKVGALGESDCISVSLSELQMGENFYARSLSAVIVSPQVKWMTDKDRESPPRSELWSRTGIHIVKNIQNQRNTLPKLKRNHSILYGDGDKKSDGSCSHFETAAAPTSSLSSSSSSETTPTFEQLLLASPPPPSIPSILTEEAVDALKIRALQYALSSYGLSVRGSREALRDRLRKRILDDPTTWDDSKLMGWLSNKRDSDTYLDPVTLVLLCEQQLDGLGFMTLTKAEIQEIGISAPEQIVRVQKTVEELKARAYGK